MRWWKSSGSEDNLCLRVPSRHTLPIWHLPLIQRERERERSSKIINNILLKNIFAKSFITIITICRWGFSICDWKIKDEREFHLAQKFSLEKLAMEASVVATATLRWQPISFAMTCRNFNPFSTLYELRAWHTRFISPKNQPTEHLTSADLC